MRMKNAPLPELSRLLSVDKISAGGIAEHIVANAQERKALAERFGLLDLPKLEAHLEVDHARGGMLAVTGKLTADVVQACVVTLEPVPAHVSDTINILFAPAHLLDKGAGSPHFDAGEEEAPEPIINGTIDLGELVAQHLAIALDPYPRKKGVSLPFSEPTPEKITNPFAELVALKKKD